MKVKAETLDQLFSNYHGLNEVRLIENKGVAFVEFDSDDYASYALNTIKQQGGLQVVDPDTGAKVQPRISFGKNNKR